MANRRQHFKKVVDDCVNIYIKKTIVSYLKTVDWDADVHEPIAEKLFQAGMEAGGISLKAMQMMGNRHDLPAPYAEKFSKAMENSVKKSSKEYVKKQCDNVEGLTDLDFEPFGCASVAQVHHGTFGGKKCVVKVLHEDIAENYREDIKTMAELGNYVDKYPEAKGAGVVLSGLSSKLLDIIDSELNFQLERKNQERVAKGMLSCHEPLKIAEVFFANQSIMVMEKLEGITAAAALRRWENGEAIDVFDKKTRLQLYLGYAHMILTNNFCQVDPHPGNFMDIGGGNVALLDFGQCSSLSEEQCERWKNFISLLPTADNNDTKDLIQRAFLEIGVDVQEKNAINALKLLFFGQGSGIFPHIDGVDQNYMSMIIVMSYLSRFETNCNSFRAAVGLQEEEHDPFLLLKVFQDEIGLRNATLPDAPQKKRGWFFW